MFFVISSVMSVITAAAVGTPETVSKTLSVFGKFAITMALAVLITVGVYFLVQTVTQGRVSEDDELVEEKDSDGSRTGIAMGVVAALAVIAVITGGVLVWRGVNGKHDFSKTPVNENAPANSIKDENADPANKKNDKKVDDDKAGQTVKAYGIGVNRRFSDETISTVNLKDGIDLNVNHGFIHTLDKTFFCRGSDQKQYVVFEGRNRVNVKFSTEPCTEKQMAFINFLIDGAAFFARISEAVTNGDTNCKKETPNGPFKLTIKLDKDIGEFTCASEPTIMDAYEAARIQFNKNEWFMLEKVADGSYDVVRIQGEQDMAKLTDVFKSGLAKQPV